MVITEKLQRGRITECEEPLFPRYLFVDLGKGLTAQSWAPIRSTLGVQRLVTFGMEPAKVSAELVLQIQPQESSPRRQRNKLFSPGDRVVVQKGPFSGIEGIFKMTDGDIRIIVLIEILTKQLALRVEASSVGRAPYP